MQDHTYKKIEVTGSSSQSSDKAITNAIGRAAKSVHGMRWFELTELRGNIEGDKVAHWQATIKIGFRLDE